MRDPCPTHLTHLASLLTGLTLGCSSAPAEAPPVHSGTTDSGTRAHEEAGPDARGQGGDTGRPAWAFVATTSAAELTQNNTSACGSSSAPCSAAWVQTHTVTYSSGSYEGTTSTATGFWDNLVSSGTQAPGSAYGRVSKVPMSTLLPGYDIPVFVETQNWWGGAGGHIDNGEVSSNPKQIANQVEDHISRGIAGQIADWYGPGTSADLALPSVLASAEASEGNYSFAVMIDKGYFSDGCGNTVTCLNSALSYIATHYGTSPAYLKDASGHPLVFFFVNDYYPTQYAILGQSGIDYSNTRFVMYEPNGFPGQDAPNTTGEYDWVNPSDTSYVTTTGSQGDFASAPDLGFDDLTGFFGNAAKNTGSIAVSSAFKGFDDNLANWSGNRIIDQQCGMTWLQTFHHTGSFGGSATYLANVNYLELGHHLDLVMVDTWDDYEEGTEIETGIDNCLSSIGVSLSGNTLSWDPVWGEDPMNSKVTGSEASLAKYSVYVAEADRTELMWLADVPCSGGACGHSLDVASYGVAGGPYVFYVQAVGQPSIVNTLAGPTSETFTGVLR
jgi:hypothetical protein